MSSAASHEPTPATTTASARVAELFERHGRMVYGICRAMLRDAHEAEDATQQAFLSAHRALLGGAHVRDPGPWIATIARNECRGRIAAGMRAPLPIPNEDLVEVPAGVDDVERRMQARELQGALAELPERQREAVVLRYVYGLRYGEVATALGLSRPATEALLFRARRAMRVRLRHAAATVLVVPFSVREELALALPGFDSRAGAGAAAAGLAGGVLAKLASAPAAAKLATATVAISTVGAVGAVESERQGPVARGEAGLVAEARPGPSARSSVVGDAGSGEHSDDSAREEGNQDGGGPDHAGREERSPSSAGGASTDHDDSDSAGEEGEGSGPEEDDSSAPDDSEESSGNGSGGHSGASESDGDDASAVAPVSGAAELPEVEHSDGDSGDSGSSSADDDSESSGSGTGSDDEPDESDEQDDETP